MKKKNHAKLAKAVDKREPKLAAELTNKNISFDTIDGLITRINAKDLCSQSRLKHVVIDASRVGFECAVYVAEIFDEKYPVPVEQVEKAFFGFDCLCEDIRTYRDGDMYKMVFDSLDVKEIIGEIRDFLEEIEELHEQAVDKVLETSPVWGMNILA